MAIAASPWFFYAAAADYSAVLHRAIGAFLAGRQGIAITKIINADNEITQAQLIPIVT